MENGNELFPVFFRLDQLNMLIVGGGLVGLEKVSAVYKNSPYAKVTLVAPDINPEITELAKTHPDLIIVKKEYEESDLLNKKLVIAATTIKPLNIRVASDARKNNILINVADTPALCDFYLSSIVSKGNLKIAISTNGKSPTFAKRIRELLEEVIPVNVDQMLDNLKEIRLKLEGDFDFKMKKLEEITSVFKNKKTDE